MQGYIYLLNEEFKFIGLSISERGDTIYIYDKSGKLIFAVDNEREAHAFLRGIYYEKYKSYLKQDKL